jgi:hypothetical protein
VKESGPHAKDTSELLARIANRVALNGHDGRSGASLERGLLDGHQPVVIKTVEPDRDLTLQLGGDPTGRERRLWADGVLDRLPAGLGHAVIAADWIDGRLVTIMRDLGNDVLSWDRRLSANELHRLFDGFAALHAAFAGNPPGGLCNLTDRLSLFAPERMAPYADRFDLVPAVLAGWERFVDLVPARVADAVLATLQDPARLANTLAAAPRTLCHGDAWLVNAALNRDEVVLLDWNLATAGPAALDFVGFTIGCASHVDLPRDLLLAAGRDACRDLVDDLQWKAAEFWGLCELGWNKALDASTHHNAGQRRAAADELAWWVERADTALAQHASTLLTTTS